MASPQREEGHIDIANEIVNQLCRYRIPGQEWQIMGHIEKDLGLGN